MVTEDFDGMTLDEVAEETSGGRRRTRVKEESQADSGYRGRRGRGYKGRGGRSSRGRGRGRGGRGVGKRFNNSGYGGANNGRLVVENLSFDTSWQTLKDVFRECGKIKRADVLMSSDNRSSGMGFIDFIYPQDVSKAINMFDGYVLDGRPIRVFAKSNSTGGGQNRRGGDGYGSSRRNDYGNSRENYNNNNRSKFSGVGHNSNAKVWVGNLAWETSWQSLKDLMRSAGDVKFVDMFTNDDGRAKGCAMVEFSSPEGAETAIDELHDTMLDGRPIIVREDKEGGKPEYVGHAEDDEEFSVYVGNIPWAWSWQELKDVCKELSSPTFVDIPQQNGRSKGFGIVKFGTESEGRKLIDLLDGQEFEGRTLDAREDRH